MLGSLSIYSRRRGGGNTSGNHVLTLNLRPSPIAHVLRACSCPWVHANQTGMPVCLCLAGFIARDRIHFSYIRVAVTQYKFLFSCSAVLFALRVTLAKADKSSKY
eukprot:3604943-Pleurochrysis_carterae.AAC.2